MFEKLQPGEKIHDAPRQLRTCSNPQVRTLTGASLPGDQVSMCMHAQVLCSISGNNGKGLYLIDLMVVANSPASVVMNVQLIFTKIDFSYSMCTDQCLLMAPDQSAGFGMFTKNPLFKFKTEPYYTNTVCSVSVMQLCMYCSRFSMLLVKIR